MFTKSRIQLAIALALGLPLTAQAEIEVSGFVKNETAIFTQSGQTIGQANTRLDTNTANDSGDVMKFQNSARLFMNGDVGEESSFHVDLNFIVDTEAQPEAYETHRNYSAHDYLREAYIDTTVGDWDLRLGKQQVVWGTADGIKLLDNVNPTDWREFVQDDAEDARIPVWMANFERNVGDSGNIQVIASISEESKIPGLNGSGDQGQPFVMKGVDTITGKVNGFYNLAPAMGDVARYFAQAAGGTAGLAGITSGTVGEFVGETAAGGANADLGGFGGLCAQTDAGGARGSAACLSDIANGYTTAAAGAVRGSMTSGAGTFATGNNNNVTNLIQDSNAEFNAAAADTVFELMDFATFQTFSSFSNMTTEWRTAHGSSVEGDIGFRYSNTTESGVNWTVNYLNHLDPNPNVSISWETQDGTPLTVAYSNNAATGSTGDTGATTSVTLQKNGVAIDPLTTTSDTAKLVFTEDRERINTIGASFDMAIDTASSPIVLRGEFAYDKGVMTPVIDRAAIAIGDLKGGLTNEETDYFKYALGADFTVAKNMMISGQFIQIRNLDYIDDTNHMPTDSSGTKATANLAASQKVRYTGDAASMHLSNSLQKAEKNKEFVSLFFSKPFGESQLGRWNNIFMWEEGGGYWNRFDVEYSFSDQLVGSTQINHYWGDENTMFGQFEKSSNLQVGLKYIFE